MAAWRLRGALLLALAAPVPLAIAADAAPAPPRLSVEPRKQAYAFADPPALVRQLIFGLAHGVTLLARTCSDAGEARDAVRSAYEEWLGRYGERIVDSENFLARHYFGERAEAAHEDDIARALKLPLALDANALPVSLREACASLPEALAQRRYNLDLVYAAQRDELRLALAVEVRAAIAHCGRPAGGEPANGLAEAGAAWEAANEALAAAARARWLRHRGDEEELRRWQRGIEQATQRSLAGGGEAACRQLVAALPSTRYRLSNIMPDGATVLPVEE